jgi:ABC-type sulfate transport system substrate-binding protein
VTLGLYSDVEALRKRGLIADGWADRLPNHSQPYTRRSSSSSGTAIRKASGTGPICCRPGVEIVTPSPKTSGNGKLSALAAWGAIVSRGGSEADARAYLSSFYEHVPVLDEGARGAATTFAVRRSATSI